MMNRTLKDNISFLCVGAAGGNVGQMLEKERVQKVMEDDDLQMDENINFLTAAKPVEKKEPEKKLSMRDRLRASAGK